VPASVKLELKTMNIDIAIGLAVFIVLFIIFSVSKSEKQFWSIIISIVFFGCAIAIVITQGFTMQSVKGLGLLGLVALLGWFRMKKSSSETAMARASFDSRLTQKRFSKCAVCGKKMSYHRMPKNFNQLFLGGLTCKNCGAEIDIPFDEFTSE
jgi:hypothetical protein